MKLLRNIRNIILALIGIPATLLELVIAVAKIPEKLTELVAAVNALVKAWNYKEPRPAKLSMPMKRRRCDHPRSRVDETPEWAEALQAMTRGDASHLINFRPESYTLVKRYVHYPARTFCEALRRYTINAKLPYTIGYLGGMDRGKITATKNV